MGNAAPAVNTGAESIAWDLSDLYAGHNDPQLSLDMASAATRAKQFADSYRGKINVAGGPAPELIAAATREIESIFEAIGKAGVFAELLHAADLATAHNGALVAWAREASSAVRQDLIFFDLEWIAVEETLAQSIIDHPSCRPYRHYLASIRRYRPHVLSEAEERVLEDKANTGGRAFSRLFDEIFASMKFSVRLDGNERSLNESEVLALLYEPQREVRRIAAAAMTKGLRDNEILLGFIFNVLVQDHAVDDRQRHYANPMDARHLANEISGATVEALMTASEARHDLVQRYYRLKRRLLGLDVLYDYDRYVPLAADTTVTTWSQCRETVLGAYAAFSPEMSDIAAKFFDQRWIDAAPRDGKRGGAFSSSTVPSAHPYVLVNYTGRVHDVMTVAHELGHGVHQYLSRPQGYLQADTPLTTAETASVFGEMLVFDHLRQSLTDPKARLALLCSKIEDTIGTVFRQIGLTRFEQRLHQARRTQGELSREAIGDIWQSVNTALYGDAVILTDDYRWWWAYIPHFIHSPFYCYAYGFGELLVLSLYQQYRREGASFVPKYLKLLAAGGSDTPENLLRPLGMNIADPLFWQQGLEPFRAMVEEAETLAA